MVQDTSAFNEIQMPYIVDDTLYLTSNVTGEPLTAYINRVWPIAALSDTASITGENQGDVAFVTGGTAVAFRGSAYWNPFAGGGGGGTFNSFNIAGDTGSDIVTDGQTVTVAGGYGINTAETGGTVTATADTTQLATQSDISGFGTMSSFTVAGGSGTPQTITNGNTLTLSEGYGINTLAAATDNVRTEVDTTQIATQNDISGLPDGSGTTNYIPKWQDANTLRNSLLYDNGTGIGLGTTTPATTLSVLGTARFSGTTDIYNGNELRIWQSGNSSYNALVFRATGSAGLAFDASGAEVLRLTSTGLFGVGTTSPSYKLDINNTGGMRMPVGTTVQRPTGAAGVMRWNSDNGWLDLHNGTAWFNPARSATTNGLFTAGSVLFGGSAGTIQQDNANFFWDDTNNKLGVGGAPGATLSVFSPAGGLNTGIALTQSANAATPGFSYSSIDFSVPTTGLIAQFLSTASNYGNAAVNLAGNSTALMNYATSGQLMFAAAGSSGFMTFNAGGFGASTERMRIVAGGSVGIGTTSPSQALHVSGGSGEIFSSTVTGTDWVAASTLGDNWGSQAAQTTGLTLAGNGTAGAPLQINTNGVTATEIAADAVGSSEIATDAVGSAEIAANAVGASELAATTVTAGTYGSATQVPVTTFDADGRATGVTNTTITGILSGLTATRIPFASGAAALIDDALLTWNNTTKRMSIGNTGGSPQAAIHVAEGSVASFEAFRAAATVSGNMLFTLTNANNAGGASNNILTQNVGGSAGGDPLHQYVVGGVGTWVEGVDNSNADKFIIGYESTPGSGSDWFTISTTGQVGIQNNAPAHALDVTGRMTATLYQGKVGTPTHTFGTGAGTTPTLNSLTGTSNGIDVQFTTGTTPSINANIISITYPTAFTTTTNPVFCASNAQTATDITKFYVSAANATAFTLTANGTLSASTTYRLRINISGR